MMEHEVVELRARVARLERALDFVCKQLGVHVPADLPIVGTSERVLALVRQGDKIGAIKAFREETGADLAAAKRKIDELG
jgi:ribosomal protein L7/L12